MKKILVIILLLCCVLPVAAKKRQSEEIITPMTQLEKRQFQTRTYRSEDTVSAMKAILNVLQDEGFIVYNVNSLLGYIYGVKDFDTSDPNVDISKEFGLTKSRLTYNGVKVATLEFSANVTPYGDDSRIRVSFRRKLLNQYGNAQMIDDIDNSEYYDDFYSKVDSAMALQKQIQQKLQKKTIGVKPNKQKTVVKPSVVEDVEQPETKFKSDVEVSADEQTVKESGVETHSDNTVKIKTEKSKSKKITDSNSEESGDEKFINEVNNNNSYDVTSDTAEYVEKTQKQIDKEMKEQLKKAKEEVKVAEKEAKNAQKEAMQAQKLAEKEAKNAQKEAMQAQKVAEKDAKKAQKEAIKAQKAAEKEARRHAKEIQE